MADDVYGNTRATEAEHREHQYSLKAKRITNIGSDMQVIIDESTAGTTYIGKAVKALAESTTGWLLTKIVESGTTTTITHAIDSWSNRATATYS